MENARRACAVEDDGGFTKPRAEGAWRERRDLVHSLQGENGGATFFPREPDGEWRSLGIADRRERFYSATATIMTTTHITYTPWDDVREKSIHGGPRSRHGVSITTDLSQHAHRIRFASRKRDRLIDRSIAIPIVSSREYRDEADEDEEESENARELIGRIIGGFVVIAI